MQVTSINYNKTTFSFDFDGVLDKKQYQLLAYYLLSLNKTIYVITKRMPDPFIENGSDEVYEVTDQLDIPRDNVIFTSDNIKSPFILHLDIEVFLDDRQVNIDDININAPDCETILVK